MKVRWQVMDECANLLLRNAETLLNKFQRFLSDRLQHGQIFPCQVPNREDIPLLRDSEAVQPLHISFLIELPAFNKFVILTIIIDKILFFLELLLSSQIIINPAIKMFMVYFIYIARFRNIIIHLCGFSESKCLLGRVLIDQVFRYWIH